MRKLAVLLFAFTFGVAACGGSDDGAQNASDSDATDTTEAKKSSGDGSASKFCGLESKYSGLDSTLTPGTDAATIRKSLEQAKDALDEAVDVAPGEIKADVKVIADAYSPFIEALAKADFDFTKVNPQDPAFANIQKPEVAAAGERIETWTKANCGTG
jgi:hypothetical protein